MKIKSLRKETLFVSLAVLGVLLFSSFIVVASDPSFLTLSIFLQNPSAYTSGMDDEEILQIVHDALVRLSQQDRDVLSVFGDEDYLDIARGTSGGIQLVSSFTERQMIAMTHLWEQVHSILVEEQVFALRWGGQAPTPKPVPCGTTYPGSCTPPRHLCHEGAGTACEWTCTSAGTWGKGRECGTAMCNGAMCASFIGSGDDGISNSFVVGP